MSISRLAPIAFAATLVLANSSHAASPGPGPDPVECPDITATLTATPSSIDRETSTSLTTALAWSVNVPKRCPESPIVTLQRRTVPLSGQMSVEVSRTTTFVLRLATENRDLAHATVTVNGDPGFISVSLGRQITTDDIAKFNAQWMQPHSIRAALDFATSTLKNRDPDGVWATSERMAAMVRMFDATHDVLTIEKRRIYLDHLRDLIKIALQCRDDLPLGRDLCLFKPIDQIRNKQGLAAWGGASVDHGGLHSVDEVVSSLYAYPIAAFARIVAEDPTLQTIYACDPTDKTCTDAIDDANRVLETVNVFLPQIRRRRVRQTIEAMLTHLDEYRSKPTADDCENAFNAAKQADPGNLARWDQKHRDCNLLRKLAGKPLPHNVNLTFSMVLIELSRVLSSDFYMQSPKHVGGFENTREFILLLISRQQRYFVNHLNPGGLRDQYDACQKNVCWYYMDHGAEDVGYHPEDADHGSMDMSYVGLVFRDFKRLRSDTDRFGEMMPFNSSHLEGFTRTFVVNIAGGRDFKHDVAGRDGEPTDNSRCEGWLELTRSEGSREAVGDRVWKACHALSLRIVDEQQPYLNIGNHSALLWTKQFLSL